MTDSNIKNPSDLDFDEGTGEMNLELDIGDKGPSVDPRKAEIGHVDRMKQKRERKKLGVDDDEYEDVPPVLEAKANQETEDETGEIEPAELDEEAKEKTPKVKVEKISESGEPEEEEAPQEFRPPSMQKAREDDEPELIKENTAKETEEEKIKNLEDALGLNDDEEEGQVEAEEIYAEAESVKDAATRRMVFDDLMFSDDDAPTKDASSGTDVSDAGANIDDLESLIADDEDEEYEVKADENTQGGVQVAGSEANFKEEIDVPVDTPVAKQTPKAKIPEKAKAPVAGAHGKCNFCKISQGKFKLAVLYQDEHVIAIMDPKPLTKGQLLVSPKKHVGSLTDMSDEEVNHFFTVCNHLCKALKNSKVPAEAVSYFLSESVNEAPERRHIYMSIIPRVSKDGIGLKYKKKIVSTPDDLELICDHLTQYINK